MSSSTKHASRRWGAFSSLRFRDFRLFWAGQSVSLTGTQMQRVAVAWHVYELTDSAVALGFIGAARLLPVLLLSLPGGVIADRIDRRKIMLLSTGMMAAASALLWVCTITGTISLPILYAAVALGSAANAFNGPARQSLIPNLVPARHLQPALTLSLLTWDVAGMTGPALGGLVLAGFGPGPVYLFDAISYGAVMVAIAMMRTGARPVVNGATQPRSGWQSMREGIGFVFGNRLIASTMLLDFFATLFGQASVLFPVFAREVLHVGPEGLGLMYSAPAVGSVITGMLVAILPPMKRHGRVLVVSVVGYGAFTILFGLSTDFWLTLVALALAGASDTVSTLVRQILRQRLTPDDMRGRMTSVNMIFFMGGPQLGELESGLVTALVGPALAVAAGGAGVLVTVVLTLILVPGLATYRDAVAAETST